MMRLITPLFFCCSILLFYGNCTPLAAQADSAWRQPLALTILGFVDVFYAYDFNRPEETTRQPFLYNHNRHHEFNLNLGLVKAGIENAKYRANLALQTGTYANDNYAAEPGLLKNIFEANIGLSLNRKNTLWLDAGILPSHIGFESALSTDNWHLDTVVTSRKFALLSHGCPTHLPTF